MNNTLLDLQNHIFEKIKKLNDNELQGEEARAEVAKAMALDNLAKSAMANVALMAKYADHNGLDVEIPVFPESAKITQKGRSKIAEKPLHP